MRTSVEFDVVLYGATGITGSMAAHYLATRPGNFTYALAGRSQQKLDAFAASLAELGLPRTPAATIEAPSDDLDAMQAIARRARVVMTAAGPFKVLAPVMVKACVTEGAHFVDVTGETLYVRDLIDKHHASAEEKGVKIVTMAGFASVPFDLGAHLVLEAAELELERRGLQRGIVDITSYIIEMRGGGIGTGAASFLGGVLNAEDAKARPWLDNDPYLLVPNAPCRLDLTMTGWSMHGWPLRYDSVLGGLAMDSFIFGPSNACLVRRSLDLMGHRNVSYAEGQTLSSLAPWNPVHAVMNSTSPYCPLGVCERLPEVRQREGGFEVLSVAQARGEAVRVSARIKGREDFAYKHTAKLFVEVGLCLADAGCHRAGLRGGVLTPVSAVGSAALRRALLAARTDGGEQLLTLELVTDGGPAREREPAGDL